MKSPAETRFAQPSSFACQRQKPYCTQPYRRAGNPPMLCTLTSSSFVSPCGLGTRERSSRYHGFACKPLRGLVTSRYGEVLTFEIQKKSLKVKKRALRLFYASSFLTLNRRIIIGTGNTENGKCCCNLNDDVKQREEECKHDSDCSCEYTLLCFPTCKAEC